MPQQVIRPKHDNGSKVFRALDALTPLNGAGAPAVNAEFLGQLYIDDTVHAVYVAKATGSVVKSDDWAPLDALKPITGAVAPAINATYIGQTYIDTVAKAVYVAIAIGSEVKANDWQKLAAAV